MCFDLINSSRGPRLYIVRQQLVRSLCENKNPAYPLSKERFVQVYLRLALLKHSGCIPILREKSHSSSVNNYNWRRVLIPCEYSRPASMTGTKNDRAKGSFPRPTGANSIKAETHQSAIFKAGHFVTAVHNCAVLKNQDEKVAFNLSMS